MIRGAEFTRVVSAAAVLLGTLGAEIASNPAAGPFIGRSADQMRDTVRAAQVGDFSLLTMPLKRIVDAQGNPTFYITAAGPVATPKPERKVANAEALVESSNPLDFTYQQVNHRWVTNNFDYTGISPNPDRSTGTIEDTNKDNGQRLNLIQPYLAKYPETQLGPGIRVYMGAQLVDVETGKFYLLTELTDQNGDIHARFEMGDDVANPTDNNTYSTRKVYNNGLSDRASTAGGMFQSAVLKRDNNGKYIEITIRYVNNPAKASDTETEQLRLDSAGKPVGDWARVAENPLKYRTYAPTTSN